MAKHDAVFKLKIVENYLAGEDGYLTITRKYGVLNDTNIAK